MSLPPLCVAPSMRRLRIGVPPTVQEAACWVGICRVLDEHALRCSRAPSESERVAAELEQLAARLTHRLRERRMAAGLL